MNKIFLLSDHSLNPIKSQLKSIFYSYSLWMGIALWCGVGVGCESTSDSTVKMNPVQKVTLDSQKKIKNNPSSLSEPPSPAPQTTLIKTDPSEADPSSPVPSGQGQDQSSSDNQSKVQSSANESSKESSSEKKEPSPPPKPPKPKKKVKKGPCKRGIHKGRKTCMIQRGEIKVSHINRGIKGKKFQIITEKNSITKEGRKRLLELLGDWREKTQCRVGYTFNFDYMGPASWRMYKCAVQDRLLWYLYLVGHHFDSEIQILSGLRSKERKTSRHHNGHAVDFRVAGVKAQKVFEFSKKSFPLVGIGYYPKGNFVHLDVGREHHQAFWVDRSGAGESALYKKGVSQVQTGRAKKHQAGMIKGIKRSLKKRYGKFKKQQKEYLKRKKDRERRRLKRKKAREARRRKARAKKRKAKNKKRRSSKKKSSKKKNK